MASKKKSPIMPAPFGGQPIFGNLARKAEPQVSQPAPIPPAEETTEEAEEAPKRFTVPIYPYSYRPRGIGSWDGTGNVVVLADAFMAPKGFDALPVVDIDSGADVVPRLIRAAVTVAGCAKYVRKAVLPTVYTHDTTQGAVRIDAKIGVYVDVKTKRAIMLDQAFGPAPRSVFGPKTGSVLAVTDNATPSAVRLLAACFAPGDDSPLSTARDLAVRGFVAEAVALATLACVADPGLLDPVRDKKNGAALENLAPSVLGARVAQAVKLFPISAGTKKGQDFLATVVAEAKRL